MKRFYPHMSNRARKLATSLPAIVIFALAIRLVFLWDYQHFNPRQAVSVIPFLFESGNIAHSVATGQGFSSPFRVPTGPTAWMTPVYPLLLAAIFKLFGAYTFGAWLAAVIFNIACIVLACVPIYFAGVAIGGDTDGRPLGALAAWLWAIFPNAILMPVESMWEASLAALLGATILWATLRLEKSGGDSVLGWSTYGLLWGATLMTNATFGALLPFLLAWLWWRNVKSALPGGPASTSGTMAKRIAITVAIATLCCVPWTIRNYRVFHQFVPLRSVLGLQLWLGNNADTQDVFRGNLHPIYNAAERERYVGLGELAYMREKKQLAIRYILSHPAREAHLMWIRFLSIWAGGSFRPLADFLDTPDLWFRWVLAFNVVAAFAALAGILLLFARRNRAAVPLAVFPTVFPWAYYLTLALPRYRLPIDPIVMLLTAVALRSAFLRLWLGNREPVPLRASPSR
jgi:hypothetical protein